MITKLNSFSVSSPFNLKNYENMIELVKRDLLINQKKSIRKKLLVSRINKNYTQLNDLDNKSKTVEPSNIWEKLKLHSTKIGPHRMKNSHVDNIRFIPKKKYLQKITSLKIIQYNAQNKNLRYNKIISENNKNINVCDHNIKQLQNSIYFLEKKYKDEYVSYLKYLSNELEKEQNLNIELLNERTLKLYKYNKILNAYKKIKKKQYDMIKWLYLQIQFKEKILKIPEYYRLIIEDNLSLEDIKKMGNCNIDIDEYNRILKYKGKNIYGNIRELIVILEKMKNSSFSKVEELEEIGNADLLKIELDELRNQYIILINEEKAKCNIKIVKLNNLKKINSTLVKKLNELKNFQRNQKICKVNVLNNKLLYFSEVYSIPELKNYMYQNEKPTLYYLIFQLYQIISQNHFKELSSIKEKIKKLKIEQEKIICVFEHAESIVNIVMKRRARYFSKKSLQKVYEKVAEEVGRRERKSKFEIFQKLEKDKNEEEEKKFKEKINKKHYKPLRKIDYEYYKCFLLKKEHNFRKNKYSYESKLEDFLHDLF